MKGTSWSLWPVNFTVVVLAHVFKLGLFYVFGEEIKPSHGLYTISDSLIGEANAQRRQHNKEKRLSRRPTQLLGEWTRYPKKKISGQHVYGNRCVFYQEKRNTFVTGKINLANKLENDNR